MWWVGGGHAYGVEVSSRGSGQDPGRAYGKDSSWAGMSRLAAAVWAVRREGERRVRVSTADADGTGLGMLGMRLAAQQRLQSGWPHGDMMVAGIAHRLACMLWGSVRAVARRGQSTIARRSMSRWRHEPMPATRAPMQG